MNKQHPFIEMVSEALSLKTGNPDKTMFRIMTTWHLVKALSTQQATVTTAWESKMPVNMYAICMAPSGAGKGHAMSTLEHGIFSNYYEELDKTVDQKEARAIDRYTVELGDGTHAEKFLNSLGPYTDTFDSGSAPAIKQLRHKIQALRYGALNLQVDEFGSNMGTIEEGLKTYLELFDMGQVKDKLTKNSKDAIRIRGTRDFTPANMLLFGTPIKIFDGASTEKLFIEHLNTGFARRCFFSWQPKRITIDKETLDNNYPEQVAAALNKLRESPWLKFLSNIPKAAVRLDFKFATGTNALLTQYRKECEEEFNRLPEFADILRTEALHRPSKTLKIAPVFALLDGTTEVLEKHLQYAIDLAEESAVAFRGIMAREHNYVRLAKFILEQRDISTQADIMSALTFFNVSQSQRNDLLNLATAWAYKNDGVIQRSYKDGVEFISGKSLEKTDLAKLVLSHSHDMAYGYVNEEVKWEELPRLYTQEMHRFCNHHTVNGHRSETSVMGGFNLLVLDVDGTASISVVETILQDYNYHLYTTKRHSVNENRFRIILPLSHKLDLDKDEYTRFMDNVYSWLPFEVDTATKDRCRMWTTYCTAEVRVHEGTLLDATQFIPNTLRQDALRNIPKQLKNLPQLERWFAMRASEGNRNNLLLRLSLVLADQGMDLAQVQERVLAVNHTLDEPLSEAEVNQTIFRTLARRAA